MEQKTAHQKSLDWCIAQINTPTHPRFNVSSRTGTDWESGEPFIYCYLAEWPGLFSVGIFVNIAPQDMPSYARDPDSRFYKDFLELVGADQPAPTPKIEDYWQSYAKQMRGELTAAQQELADLKAAYNGLCEAHKELAETAADAVHPSPSAIFRHTEKYLEEQDYNGYAGDSMIRDYIRTAVKNVMLRYSAAINKKHHGKVPE